MVKVFQIITAIYAVLAFAFPAMAEARLTVFAAASLKTALDDAAQTYKGDVALSYGGSGLLARQIAAGAPADLVILANGDWMDWLVDQGYVQADSRVALLGNRLVLIAPAPEPILTDVSTSSFVARLNGGRLAMGHRDSVPAGIYAQQWLHAAGLWPAVSAHLAETENVRAALALVSRKEAPMGIVYASDANAEARVSVIYTVPQQMHDVIRYPAGVVAGGRAREAQAFLNHLTAPETLNIFYTHGFLPPEDQQ